MEKNLKSLTNKKEFKYHPKTKEELQDLANDRSIYLGDIDMSAVSDSSFLFFGSPRNEKEFDSIESWGVLHVTNMHSMFNDARKFNQPLNDWNVSNVTNMSFYV